MSTPSRSPMPDYRNRSAPPFDLISPGPKNGHLPVGYSMTSSARASSVCGTVKPSALAKIPALNFFSEIPFGMTADELSSWIAFGGGQELWDEIDAAFNHRHAGCAQAGQKAGPMSAGANERTCPVCAIRIGAVFNRRTTLWRSAPPPLRIGALHRS